MGGNRKGGIRKMKEKIIGILVMTILIATAILPVAGTKNMGTELNKKIFDSSYIDELDQSQVIFEPSDDLPIPVGKFPLYSFSIQTAQSFKPSKNMLTRIQLFVGRNGSTIYPYTLSIRNNLNGENLVDINVNPSSFTVEDYSWVEFDFEDIWMNVGQTYYIVCRTVNASGNWYLWPAHNDSLSYPHGCAWVSIDGGNTWSNESSLEHVENLVNFDNHIIKNLALNNGYTWDTCFKTYGRDNLPPNSPNINGPTSGKTGNEYDYTFITLDPEGDDVYYLIDWGDGSVDEWVGPYGSNELAIISHSWSEQGNFTIRTRSKDAHGIIGAWATLEVTMPKSKQYFPLGMILAFGFDVDVKIVQLEPGEDYVDLEVLSKPFYIWENEINTINSGAFIRLYFAKGLFSPSVPICFGICDDWSIIG